jgi:hypothetical protein
MAAGGIVFLFDANVSPRISNAFTALGENVVHIEDVLARGVLDEVWIPYAAEQGFFVVTFDRQIRKRPHQKALFMNAGIGVFFMADTIKGHCKIVQTLMRHWPEMKKLARATKRPFALEVRERSVRSI